MRLQDTAEIPGTNCSGFGKGNPSLVKLFLVDNVDGFNIMFPVMARLLGIVYNITTDCGIHSIHLGCQQTGCNVN